MTEPTSRHRRDRPHRRAHGDEGAAVVEAAIAAPILFLILFAILEYGVVFRDWLTLTTATSDAAAVGSTVGDDVSIDGENADFVILETFRESTAGIPVEWIERIVVFKARDSRFGSADEQIPDACKNGSGAGLSCNVYDPQEAFFAVQQDDTNFFDCGTNPASPACNWQPECRDDHLTDEPDAVTCPGYADAETVDHLGVWMRIDRPYLTGMFGDVLTIDDGAVLRLEPGPVAEG